MRTDPVPSASGNAAQADIGVHAMVCARWGSGEANIPGRNPNATRLARIQPAQGWSMGFQGESGHHPLVMGVSGEQERSA